MALFMLSLSFRPFMWRWPFCIWCHFIVGPIKWLNSAAQLSPQQPSPTELWRCVWPFQVLALFFCHENHYSNCLTIPAKTKTSLTSCIFLFLFMTEKSKRKCLVTLVKGLAERDAQVSKLRASVTALEAELQRKTMDLGALQRQVMR